MINEEKALPVKIEPIIGNQANRFDQDYRAVISQIKREILIEISGGPAGQWYWRKEGEFRSLSDQGLQRLLEEMRFEARRRGLSVAGYYPARGFSPAGVTQSLLAVLFFPTARRRLERILFQTVQGGLELVDQASSLLERTRSNILTMLEDEML